MISTLEHWQGCLLGAAIGDALGMAGESNPPSFKSSIPRYKKAYKSHPNAPLAAGQYTDDTQMMLLVSELIAEGVYSEIRYAEMLKALYAAGMLRFPDASVAVACERLVNRGLESSGVNSNTAGCISIAIPFALAYPDSIDIRERVVKACSVTHTHSAAHAASVAVALLLHDTLCGAEHALEYAIQNASIENPLLGERCWNALHLEKEGIGIEKALNIIGNDISVYQTVPLAFFLINRYEDPEKLLGLAVSAGGNSDTIGCICGAYAGARHGTDAFPEELLRELEDREEILALAARLFDVYKKH